MRLHTEEMIFHSLKLLHLKCIRQLWGYRPILETIDRISSLKAFRFYVEEEETELLKKEAKQLAIQYTYDGKQYFDQGELFMELKAAKKYEFALKSYEIALELSPNEFYAPKCYEQMGKILKFKQQYTDAQKSFEKACQLYAFYDDVDNFTECEELLRDIKNKIKNKQTLPQQT